MWKILHKLSSPQYFYTVSGKLIPWVTWLTLLLFVSGLIDGLILAPADYQQGDAFRIIYIHVPAAFMSLFIYSIMSVCAVVTIIWRIKIADVILRVSAPLGAWITLLALATGSIWGEPMWGTWWIWDARLTSELILLFIYVGIITLSNAIRDRTASMQATAIMVLVGFVDIPIIHYSVYWWNSLHQGATLAQFAKPTIAAAMLYPLLLMIAAFLGYYSWQVLSRARNEILVREKHTYWVKKLWGKQ